MMIEVAQPWIAQPDSHHAVAGFPLHEASRARGTAWIRWRDVYPVLHFSIFPIHLVHGGQGSLPLKTRSFLDYCVPRLRAALADLLPADAAVLTGDLSSS